MSALLVDTSVWVSHFSGKRPDLAEQLDSARVHLHEFILGELILGSLPRGDPLIRVLPEVPRLAVRSHDEVVELVQRFRLEGSGIGWPDAHLLASARASGAELWTFDVALLRAAARVGVQT